VRKVPDVVVLVGPCSLRSAVIEIGARVGACDPALPHAAATSPRTPGAPGWRPYAGAALSYIAAHTCSASTHSVWYLLGDTLGAPRIWRVRLHPLGMELWEVAPGDVRAAGEMWRDLTARREG
jgi:hypothetical protein